MPSDHLPPVITDWNACFSSMIGRKRASTFEISNVGSSLTENEKGAPPQSAWQIRRLLFSQSAGAISAAFKVSVATSPDGRLKFSYTWQQGIVEDDFIKKVIERVLSGLIELRSEKTNLT